MFTWALPGDVQPQQNSVHHGRRLLAAAPGYIAFLASSSFHVECIRRHAASGCLRIIIAAFVHLDENSVVAHVHAETITAMCCVCEHAHAMWSNLTHYWPVTTWSHAKRRSLCES